MRIYLFRKCTKISVEWWEFGSDLQILGTFFERWSIDQPVKCHIFPSTPHNILCYCVSSIAFQVIQFSQQLLAVSFTTEIMFFDQQGRLRWVDCDFYLFIYLFFQNFIMYIQLQIPSETGVQKVKLEGKAIFKYKKKLFLFRYNEVKYLNGLSLGPSQIQL